MVNLVGKRERVTTGSKSEVGKITGIVVDAPSMDILGKRHGAFGGMAVGKMEVLLVLNGLDVDRIVEA